MNAAQVQIPLFDAQMLLGWMDETFGNDDGTDWLDEDAAAVGDALNKAIENFKRMRAAVAPIAAAESFYQHIAHGDDEHRAWLKRETVAWFATNAATVPTVAQPVNTDSVPGSPGSESTRPSEQDGGSSIGLGAEGEQ